MRDNPTQTAFYPSFDDYTLFLLISVYINLQIDIYYCSIDLSSIYTIRTNSPPLIITAIAKTSLLHSINHTPLCLHMIIVADYIFYSPLFFYFSCIYRWNELFILFSFVCCTEHIFCLIFVYAKNKTQVDEAVIVIDRCYCCTITYFGMVSNKAALIGLASVARRRLQQLSAARLYAYRLKRFIKCI